MTGCVTVSRCDKERGKYEQTFLLDIPPNATVLDVLNYIYTELDSTLAFPRSCRNGKCGLCTVDVNGKPCLACNSPATEKMVIAPIKGFPVIKDLVTDRSAVIAAVNDITFATADEKRKKSEAERIIMKENDKDRFIRGSQCIECMSCMSVCPVWRKNIGAFAGPMPFVRLSRLAADPRDTADRRAQAERMGVSLCISCGLCSKLCPENIDPCGLIKIFNEE